MSGALFLLTHHVPTGYVDTLVRGALSRKSVDETPSLVETLEPSYTEAMNMSKASEQPDFVNRMCMAVAILAAFGLALIALTE